MPDQEKTERATAKRREDLRRKGQVARSPEVLTAFVLGAGLLGLWVGSEGLYAELASLAQKVMGGEVGASISTDSAAALFVHVTGTVTRAVAPMLVAAVVGGIVGNLVQVGAHVSWEALNPDLNRVNPISGFANLFNKAKIVDLLKSLLKVSLVGWVAYATIDEQLLEFPHLATLPPRPLLVYMLGLGFGILKNVLLAYILIALLDYAFQRWQFEEKNKMTKQEVKDEYKETEGDPLLKSRIRSLQREMARRRMMAEVPASDVVITNPTHFAVALRYDSAEMEAPVVVAKGADQVAARIIAIAREHGVPRYHAPLVARALYRQVELGDPIPGDLFHAVAEILAQVYELSKRAAAR